MGFLSVKIEFSFVISKVQLLKLQKACVLHYDSWKKSPQIPEENVPLCVCVFVLGHVFFPGWQLEADSYKDMLCLSQQSSQKQHQQKQMNHKKTEEEESKQTEQK